MNYCELCFLSLFDLMLISSRTSAYYTKNYGDYNLTIRDNAGNQLTTQRGAQDWCRYNLNGSSLASVTNSGLQTNIEQFANDAFSQRLLGDNNIILNGQLELNDWHWLSGQTSANTEVQGRLVESEYLSYAFFLTGNYSLMASKPTGQRSYLCQYSGDTSYCGGYRFEFQGRCYRKYDNPKVSWFDARINCQKEGGDLASFDYLTKETLSTLNSSALYPATSTDYWVGLKRLKWKWIDKGSEVNFTFWFNGQPSDYNKKCICLGPWNYYNRKWIECDCNQYHQFVCLTVLSQTTAAVSSTTFRPLTSSSSSLQSDSSESAATTNYSYMSSLKSSYISTTPANSSKSSQQNKSDQELAVGLGVGLGVGVPLIILLIVVVALLIRKRKRNPVVINKSKSSLVNDSLESPQMELQNDEELIPTKDQPTSGIYAMVLQQKEGSHDQATERQPVVYDKLEHVNQH